MVKTSKTSSISSPAIAQEFFPDSLEHILAEMESVRLLLQIPLHLADAKQADSGAEQKIARTEQQKDALRQWNERVTAKVAESLRRGVKLRLLDLKTSFQLSGFEVKCLLLCLAAELDLRYQRVYAHLQGNASKRLPTVDLVCDLLCSSVAEKLKARARFTAESPLVSFRLVNVLEDPSQQPATSLLSSCLRVEPRIANHLLDGDALEPRINECAAIIEPTRRLDDLVLPAEKKARLGAFAARILPMAAERVLIYLEGAKGSGRRSTAEALCREWNCGLLVVSVERLRSAAQEDADEVLRLILREALLRRSVLYFDEFESLLADDKQAARKTFLWSLRRYPGLIFLAGHSPWLHVEDTLSATFYHVPFAPPDYRARLELWRRMLDAAGCHGVDPSLVANQFRMTGGQIERSVESAKRSAFWRDTQENAVTADDLSYACRLHSTGKLSSLGKKTEARHTWSDLVLPADRLQQLHEIRNSVKYRARVLEEWGFDRKNSLGKGLNVLFAGPSGTGKTMAAEVLAGELALDLYKIDLSLIVSKYIGETEKNLARIFAEAASSNAILFFDEADALFGKRTEVRDSHDRYANIEVNYLLQKMEEHEGMVILATNFRKNMDDAFVRRVHFTVEFPLPSPEDRLRIWEQIWPTKTPRDQDVDLGFMAARFEIPGGNIRNIAMAAAYLAASNGGVVNMEHVLHGIRREYQKMGKIVSNQDFSVPQINDREEL